MGTATVYIVVLVIVFYLIEIPASRFLVKIKRKIKFATDKRLNVINQLIQGIRTIKLYGWEEPMLDRAKAARKVECMRFCKQFAFRGFINAAFNNVNTILYLPVILVPLYNGQLLEAATIYSSLNALDMLANNSISRFNSAVNNLMEYITVIKRL